MIGIRILFGIKSRYKDYINAKYKKNILFFRLQNRMDENCQAFTNKFVEIIKNCVPQKEVTIRLNDKVWFNSELRRKIRKRDRLVHRSNSDFNINKYKKQRIHIHNLKRHAKEQLYFNVNTLLDEFSSSNSKSYWSLIKNWSSHLEIYHK